MRRVAGLLAGYGGWGWILIGLFGPGGSLWLLVGTLVVGVVFFMIFGVIRVLGGHEL